jgi:hypothetical protein
MDLRTNFEETFFRRLLTCPSPICRMITVMNKLSDALSFAIVGLIAIAFFFMLLDALAQLLSKI